MLLLPHTLQLSRCEAHVDLPSAVKLRHLLLAWQNPHPGHGPRGQLKVLHSNALPSKLEHKSVHASHAIWRLLFAARHCPLAGQNPHGWDRDALLHALLLQKEAVAENPMHGWHRASPAMHRFAIEQKRQRGNCW